jgi:DNA modification methylase
MRTRTIEPRNRVTDVDTISVALPKVRLVALGKLKPSKRNARTHSKKQIGQIANSIAAFGWTYPILTDEDDNIIAGEGRWKAARLRNIREVPVIVMPGLSDAQKRALALADNKIAANAGYDRAMLAMELGELAVLLPECDLCIEVTGFEPAEIDSVLGDLSDPDRDPADEVPSSEHDAVSAPGDLWGLGPHKLMCGNSLVSGNYEKLMGSNLAAMAIADAPYNLKIKSIQGRGKIKHREFAEASGEMSRQQFTGFLSSAMSLAAKHSISGSMAFWFMDWRHMAEILEAGEAIYGQLQNLVVWAKTNGGQGSLYRSQHELIFLFKNGDAPHLNNVELGKHGRNRSNVWTYAGANSFRAGRMDDLAIHPTVKPVALIADAMRDCSRRGDIVIDPFVGSGTTILAAERVGRRAYGIELDPLYVDTAIRRWQHFTKRDAILLSNDKTFEEIANARKAHIRVRRLK